MANGEDGALQQADEDGTRLAANSLSEFDIFRVAGEHA